MKIPASLNNVPGGTGVSAFQLMALGEGRPSSAAVSSSRRDDSGNRKRHQKALSSKNFDEGRIVGGAPIHKFHRGIRKLHLIRGSVGRHPSHVRTANSISIGSAVL